MKRILRGALICALIVVMSMALWPASVSALGIAIYVRGDFVDDPVNHKYNTIQKGINAARDGEGDTVYVYAGTYTEDVYINKSRLTIHGQSRTLVHVVSQNPGNATIEIQAGWVTLEQLSIEGGSPGVKWGDSGGSPVYNGAIEKCNITGNTIGMLMENLEYQSVLCTDIYNNSSDGLRVVECNAKEIGHNKFYSNDNDGLALYDSTSLSTFYNKSYENDGYGIYLDEYSQSNESYLNDFYDNDFDDNVPGPGPDGYSGGAFEDNQWETPENDGRDYCYNGDQHGRLGNYWGDYAGSDGDGDGIGDSPHPLGLNEQDVFPLVSFYTNYRMGTCPGQDVPSCPAEQWPPGEGNGNGGGGGGCFIATAAYGSYLDSHVETLRNFRDSYMLTNPVGSALVSAYYKLSPPVADFIDDHPALKPIVRAGLMPAVAMSTVAVNTTSAEKIAIVGSLALVSVALALWLSRRRTSHLLGLRDK